MKPRIVIVCGPTATGKTGCSIKIARAFNGEIVNADSMQVYRELSIGTAKPTAKEREQATFHLVDVASPDETFSTGRFKRLADRAIGEIVANDRLPIIAGGTGLYLKALTQGLFEGPPADQALRDRLMQAEKDDPGCLHNRLQTIDPAKAKALPATDLGRIVRAIEVFESSGVPLSQLQKQHSFKESDYRVLWIGLNFQREKLYRRIDRRIEIMIEAGWVEEVASLKARGFGAQGAARNALGYRTLLDHLDGKCTLDQAVDIIKRDTRKFAKRQITWYKPNEKIHWFVYPDDMDDILNLVKQTLPNL
jgi:tRNA dimethylallyltransferase